MDGDANLKRYVDRALAMGADDAVEFAIGDIVFDPRTLIKCMFGCKDWGCGPTCPSRAGWPGIEAWKTMLTNYRRGVIVHSTDKALAQEISFAIERQAFLDGAYFVFSLSDCALCDPCVGTCGGGCAFPEKARPAFHSVGIDVFATARRFGLPIRVLRDRDERPDWYSAVFID
jgi:predicted metal-binding protein